MIHLANGVSFSCIAFAEVVLDVDGRVIYSDLLCESDNWEQASKDVRLKYGARYTIIWQGGNELPASPGPKGSR
jgi:hypothetical protein